MTRVKKIPVKLKNLTPVQQKIMNQSSRFNAVAMGEQAGKTTLGIEALIASPYGVISGRGDVVWLSPTANDLNDVRRTVKAAIDGLIESSPNISRIDLIDGNSVHFLAADDLPPEASASGG